MPDPKLSDPGKRSGVQLPYCGDSLICGHPTAQGFKTLFFLLQKTIDFLYQHEESGGILFCGGLRTEFLPAL